MVHFQKSKECACSLLLSPKFEAVLSCRAFSEGSFAPWDSPAFTQNTCHRFIHSQRARKGEREKLRERELLTNHLWTAILQQTLIFTFSPSFHQTSKLQIDCLSLLIFHIYTFCHSWATLNERSGRQMFYSWEIPHKNLLTAFNVFNCLKDQCKVLTLQRAMFLSTLPITSFPEQAAKDKYNLECISPALGKQLFSFPSSFFFPLKETLIVLRLVLFFSCMVSIVIL